MQALQQALVVLSLAIQAYASSTTPTMATSPVARFEPPPLILSLMDKYGADLSPTTRQEIIATIACESGFSPSAHNLKENSRGLAQIHQKSWPNITDEQAFDPDYSIQFIIKAFKEGHQGWWTCARKLKTN